MESGKDKLDICIPTLRPWSEIQDQVAEIERHTATPHRIIASCLPGSASVNRNFCLEYARSPLVVMLDDDVSGFFPGWESKLIEPLLAVDDICMVGARLMNADGTVQQTCCGTMALEPNWITILPQRDHVMASAAIAFRSIGLRFDEGLIGSGFEDGDFCLQYVDLGKGYTFAVNNECQLVHGNEMKHQYENGNFQRNRQYLWDKRGIS